ncbi:hypothetical protein F5X97DRAFT_22966 [Nemania serpens]|nr:hypothetical protein F5X97DRAFT_22966 [Nemania serpens]
MAPSSSKGANPAPDYTVSMNRIQTRLEAQLRIVRGFMPARPPPTTTTSSTSPSTTTKPTPSFSSLASQPPNPNSNLNTTTASNPRSRSQPHEAEENLFAAQDPNAGLGFGSGGPRRAGERGEKGGTARDRENQVLRSRLLGRKRGVAAAAAGDARGGTTFRQAEGEGSSDEEPGRSGLGRAKKRARRADADEDEVASVSVSVSFPVIESEALDVIEDEKVRDAPLNRHGVETTGLEVRGGDEDGDEDEGEDGDRDVKDSSGTAFLRDDSVRDVSADVLGQDKTKKNKKRKKKKKKEKKEKKDESK